MAAKKEDLGQQIGKALQFVLTSPNEADSNGETANVVDGLFAIARAIRDLAAAIRESRTE